MTPAEAEREHAAAMRDLFDAERRIENLTRWEQPQPDSLNGTLLASFERKRARAAERAQAAAAFLPAKRERIFATAAPIQFAAREPVPVGTLTVGELEDIPDFLRRATA